MIADQSEVSNPLEKLGNATRALAEAKSLDDIRQIRDIAEAARTYARAAEMGIEAQNHAAEIKLRAERKAGEFLAEMEKAKATDTQVRDSSGRITHRSHDETDGPPTLTDLGINKSQSSRWQTIATLPEDDFEEYIGETTAHAKELTTAGALRKAKEHKREQKSKEREETQEEIESVEADKPIAVQSGEWWQLGQHRLYCGDTSQPDFYNRINEADFVFADPPYNAGVDEWDVNFEWNHDWLIDVAPIVAVTPGIASIQNFLCTTKMPYAWSMSCWIDNGMTRGAMGFGNWIYIALFSDVSLYRNAQDFVKVSIQASDKEENNFKGRKPSALLHSLLDTFTQEGQTVVDPFLGSGTTLLVAEKMGCVCIGGEIDSDRCGLIIAKWQELTGGKAEVLRHG